MVTAGHLDWGVAELLLDMAFIHLRAAGDAGAWRVAGIEFGALGCRGAGRRRRSPSQASARRQSPAQHLAKLQSQYVRRRVARRPVGIRPHLFIREVEYPASDDREAMHPDRLGADRHDLHCAASTQGRCAGPVGAMPLQSWVHPRKARHGAVRAAPGLPAPPPLVPSGIGLLRGRRRAKSRYFIKAQNPTGLDFRSPSAQLRERG